MMHDCRFLPGGRFDRQNRNPQPTPDHEVPNCAWRNGKPINLAWTHVTI
jgi:hypothetical protein